MLTRRFLHAAFLLLTPLAWYASRMIPPWSNNFAFVVLKPTLPGELHPWLVDDHGTIVPDESWILARYARRSSGNGQDRMTNDEAAAQPR